MLLVGDSVHLKKIHKVKHSKNNTCFWTSKYYGNYTTNSNNALSKTKYNKKHFSCICNRPHVYVLLIKSMQNKIKNNKTTPTIFYKVIGTISLSSSG